MWLLLLFFLGAAPAWAEDLGELSANPAGLSGSFSFFGLFGFFGFPISQPNERDTLNKPNKRNEPVWSLPTAAACELKDADPTAEPLALTHASPALPKISVSRYPAASCFSAHDFLQPQGGVLKRKDRYDTADLGENQFEPGSRRRVLKNLLGITSKREMDRMEGREQLACSKSWQDSMTAIIDSLPLIFAACINSG